MTDADAKFYQAMGVLLDEQLSGAVFALVRSMSLNPRMVSSRVVYVDTLVVDDIHHRNGIGRRLMESVYAWAVEQKAQCIALSVWSFNEGAIDFYRPWDIGQTSWDVPGCSRTMSFFSISPILRAG